MSEVNWRGDELEVQVLDEAEFMLTIPRDLQPVNTINRFFCIGDSNLRNAWNHCALFEKYAGLADEVTIDALGGRSASHLGGLVRAAREFRYVIVMVGNNDFNRTQSQVLLSHFKNFVNNLQSVQKIKILALLHRKDNDAEKIKKFNKELSKTLPNSYFPSKIIQRRDFDDKHRRTGRFNGFHIKEESLCKYIDELQRMVTCLRHDDQMAQALQFQ